MNERIREALDDVDANKKGYLKKDKEINGAFYKKQQEKIKSGTIAGAALGAVATAKIKGIRAGDLLSHPGVRKMYVKPLATGAAIGALPGLGYMAAQKKLNNERTIHEAKMSRMKQLARDDVKSGKIGR